MWVGVPLTRAVSLRANELLTVTSISSTLLFSHTSAINRSDAGLTIGVMLRVGNYI